MMTNLHYDRHITCRKYKEEPKIDLFITNEKSLQTCAKF